ncbi:MAG: TAXI family TRAP transporter solute-binding subunit, partial [Fretibacterium sp.]|nr:TAXI family TRAP transporter solute-binding subunit [Fretibacterium sp.]
MKRLKRFILLAAAVTLFGLVSVPVASSAGPITLMGLSTSSVVFPYVVSIARVLSTFCPEYTFLVNESDGIMDNMTRIRSGRARLANSIALTDYESYFGKGVRFRDKPFKDFRILWYYQKSMVQIVVARDSGIKTLHDLNGRSFSRGGTGTTSSEFIREIFNILNIRPNYLESKQIEAAQAYISGYVDGIVKIGPVPDTYLEHLNASRPVRFISFSSEDKEKILKALPAGHIDAISMNDYDGVDYDVNCFVTYHGIQSDMSFTQEEGYRFFKAMWE